MDKLNKKLANIFRIESNYHEKIVLYHEKYLIVQYKKALDAIRLSILKMYESGIQATYAEMAKYNRLTNLEKLIAEELKKLSGESIKTTKTAIIDSFQQSYYFAGYGAESTLNLRLGFGLLDSNVIKAAIINPYDRIGWIERSQDGINKLNQKIRQYITQGLIQGEGYIKTAKNIKEEMGKDTFEKIRIVRTEGHRAQSTGRLRAFEKAKKAAEENDVKINRMWVSTLDTRTRDRHARLDGKFADKNGLFHIDNISTPGPGLSGIASFDINCRCDDIMQFQDIPYKFRRENIEEKDIMDFSSFESWAQEKGIKENKFRHKYKFN